MSNLVSTLSAAARSKIVNSGQGLDKALDQVLDQAFEASSGQLSLTQEAKLRQELASSNSWLHVFRNWHRLL